SSMPIKLLDEIFGKQFYRRHLWIDSQADQVLIDEPLHLLAGIAQLQSFVLVPLLGHAKQVPESLGRHAEWIGGGIRENDIQTRQEFLKVNLEVGAKPDILHRGHCSVN